MTLRNHTLMKMINRARIMNAIRLKSPLSRAQVAKEVGLDKKSVTNFVNELIGEKLLEETGKQEGPMGRPGTLLQFKEKVALGIDFLPNMISGVAMDYYGNILYDEKMNYPLDSDWDTICAKAKKLYRTLKEKYPDNDGVGICLPGIIDMRESVVRTSVNMPALVNLNFKEAFGAFIKEPIYFEEMAKSRALAEKWFGYGKDYKDFVCIETTGGIGAGIINDRRIFRGAGMYAGEIGHICIRHNGKRCRCGNRGCLEAYLAEDNLMKEFSSALGVVVQSFDDLRGKDLSLLNPVLENAGEALGEGIATVINLLNPNLIVLCGPLIRQFEQIIMPSIQKAILDNSLTECAQTTRVLSSKLHEHPARGAATIVLSKAFEVDGYYYI